AGTPALAVACEVLHRQTALTHTDTSSDASRRGHRPAAASSSSLGSPRSQLVSASWALEVFSEHLLERRCIKHRLRQQLLQPAVLILKCLQFAGVRDLHPAISRSPLLERRIADPVLPAQLPGRHAGRECSFRTPMICSSVNLLLRMS